MDGGHVLIVGSGPSAVHYAQSALERDCRVTMVDVGRQGPVPVLPEATFDQLKDDLADPVAYFLGDRFSGAVLPDFDREYYGIPPSKDYVFEVPSRFVADAKGFDPLFSFARGGLAQAWTAGCYPFNDAELEDFPFGYDRLAPYYAEVAGRIGVSGERDDLSRFMPVHGHLLDPIPYDAHSALLMQAYGRRRHALNGRLGAFLGRTRVATLTHDRDGRMACTRLGRCLWGCPRRALYTPSQTLDALMPRAAFTYRPGLEVLQFRYADNGRVTGLDARSRDSRERVSLPVDHLVLAAGTLSTSAILLRSVLATTGERVRLTGVMDNRQVLVPFLTWRMLGRPHEAESYQYHLLGLGLVQPNAKTYVHGQITTLKTAMMHPIVQQLPFDLGSSLAISRLTHAALGVINVNFHDTRRESNWLQLEGDGDDARLRIRYEPDRDEPVRVQSAMQRVRRVLRALGCIVPPGMVHLRPMGASVHYAGTLPMSMSGVGRWTTDDRCRSRVFPNLTVADGATLPFLPAKNLTFTLMANAARIAAEGV